MSDAIIDAPVTPAAPPPVATTPPVAPTTPTPSDSTIVQKPWAADWIKSDMTLDHKALDRMPEHLRGLKDTLGRTKSFEDVLTMMQNQQVLVGKKALGALPADAPESVRAERKALLDSINGVPKEAKDYGITKPADMPDAQWNPKLAEGYAAWAHKHSIPPSAAKELVATQLAAVKTQLEAQQAHETQFWQGQQQSFEQTLKAENMPLDRANSLVEKGAIALGLDMNDPETQQMMKGSKARLMAMRHAISTSEDTFVQGGTTRSTEADPRAAALDIQQNKANPLNAQYWNRDGKFSRAQQETAKEKVAELYKLASAKTPARR